MINTQPANPSAHLSSPAPPPKPAEPSVAPVPKNPPSEVPQSESLADISERTQKEEAFIVPVNNDGYHEKILSMLKIANNKPLNLMYYKIVPQINKGSLLMLDLSTSLNDSRVKTFVDALLPDSLFRDCIFFRGINLEVYQTQNK